MLLSTKSIFGMAGAAVMAFSLSASESAAATMFNVTDQIGSGAVEYNVTLEDVGSAVTVTVTVDSSNTGNIADITGVFFDLDGFVAGDYSIFGANVNGVDDGGNVVMAPNNSNINPAIFNIGVGIGRTGLIAPGGVADDFQTTSFTVASLTGTVTESDFFGQAFGVRGQSVGAIGSGRDESSKTITIVPNNPNNPPVVPLPASSLLLLAGIGGFGVMRRMKRKA